MFGAGVRAGVEGNCIGINIWGLDSWLGVVHDETSGTGLESWGRTLTDSQILSVPSRGALGLHYCSSGSKTKSRGIF